MSLKVKLFSCISAFIIVVSLMLISVFAATNVTLNIGGNVSFTANSVNALITGSIAGNAAGGSTLTSIDIDASDSDGAVSMPTDWTNMDLTFAESASPITVTINIQNRSTDREIAVSLTDSTNISNVTVTRECDGSGITASDSRNIPGGETITYTFELNVHSQNSSASGDFGLSVELENAVLEGYTATIIVYNDNSGPISEGGWGWTTDNGRSGGGTFGTSEVTQTVVTNVQTITFYGDRSGSARGDLNISLSTGESYSVTASISYNEVVIELTQNTTFTITG